jgi:hypothetical protein
MIISKDHETKGLSLDDKLNSDFLSIMKDHNEHVLNTYPEDSFQYIFWKNQITANEKNPHVVKWHTMMLKWCIFSQAQVT